MPGPLQESEAALAQQTWPGVELAGPSSGARHGHAMDSGADCGDERAASPGDLAVVEHQRGLCHPAERDRRRSLAHHGPQMGTAPGSCL